MLHIHDEAVRAVLLQGHFGLERETLRVTQEGFLSHERNPFVESEHIVRDFSENQVEINTSVCDTPEEAVAELVHYDAQVQRQLAVMKEPELLWPFSNPPYIRNERDIPIAQFEGELAFKTAYREHLANTYGRYKMAFSGIHFNFSFGEDLFEADFAATGRPEQEYAAYKDEVYLGLAEQCVRWGWLMTAITAASPLLDSSYVEKGKMGQDLFMGIATVRCSELGYWNAFVPILDYRSMPAYAQSIQQYVDQQLIVYPSELYYPIRLKPRGRYGIQELAAGGVSHIELRMFDLNPLEPSLVNVEDVRFGQLFLLWLAGMPRKPLTVKDQVHAVQNFKSAAHYDLKTVQLVAEDGPSCSFAAAALRAIDQMDQYFRDCGDEVYRQVKACLAFQRSKFEEQENRYPWMIRERFSDGFVNKGLELARQHQRTCVFGSDVDAGSGI